MKCSIICILLLCFSVFGAEVDNEIELNEIDVDEAIGEKSNWEEYTTKNPLQPLLSHNKKKAKTWHPRINSSTDKTISKDSENSNVRSAGSKLRKTRSIPKENDNQIEPIQENEQISNVENKTSTETTTEEIELTTIEKIEKIEANEPSTSTIKPIEYNENLIDSETEVTSTTKLDEEEETSENTILTDTTTDTTVTTDIDEVKEDIVVTTTEVIKDLTNETFEENLISTNETILDKTLQKVDKLSDQIRSVLQHYQKAGVVALPGKNLLPDPLPMADAQNNFGFGTSMTFTNMSVYGLNNFTIEHVNTDVDKLQVYLLLHMKRVVILGNYTLKSFFRRAAGPFNVTLVDVDSEGGAELTPDEEGHLQATKSQMDMTTTSMKTDFKNLNSGLLSSIIDGAGLFLFDSMKPTILEKVNTVLRSDFNGKLKSITSKFAKSVSPVDMALATGRQYCKTKGYDPYHVQNLKSDQGFFVVYINDFYLEGMSRFYRVGNLSISMDSGVIQIGVHVATGQLNGTCDWSIEAGKYMRRSKSEFTVEYLQVRALVNQSLDLRQHPQIEKLDVGLGRVHLKPTSNSPIDLIIAKVVNSLPILIRHIIVDAVEQPLKTKVQEILNDINIKKIVDKNLPELDEFGL